MTKNFPNPMADTNRSRAQREKKIKSYHKGSQREKKADYVQRNKYKNYNRILTCMVIDKKSSLKC